MDFEAKSHVYILVDDSGRVTQIEGECSLSNIHDLSKAILVEEGAPCERLNHAQNHYLPKPLYTGDWLYRYKWTGTKIVERTAKELEADRAVVLANQVHNPSQGDVSRLMVMMAQDVSGEVALSIQSMYNVWEAGKRYGYDGCEKIVKVPNSSPHFGDPYLLYRCNQPHTSQADWQPQVTPSLWTRIDKSHGGGESDPVPATRGMEYTYGMYYSDPEDNGLYKCTRTGEADGGTVTLQYLPHELVGHYFVFVRSLSE